MTTDTDPMFHDSGNPIKAMEDLTSPLGTDEKQSPGWPKGQKDKQKLPLVLLLSAALIGATAPVFAAEKPKPVEPKTPTVEELQKQVGGLTASLKELAERAKGLYQSRDTCEAQLAQERAKERK